jgi:response regulator RpfG family c-di-GMP phosphodiesterase
LVLFALSETRDQKNNMTEKILFVDDEPAVLAGYKRLLYPEFEVDTAEGAANAFAAIKKNGPYAVIISDMRMPIMNGAEFLAEAHKTAPDTVRMLLTGFTDLNAAIDAINRGNIFRFLTKPCDTDTLSQAITTGIEQYRLITSERELLEKTLMGSIQLLSDVLSAASPEVFGRSMRISHYVRHIMTKIGLSSSWYIEAAATLSQLGCITLESQLMQRAYAGVKLSPEEQSDFNLHPEAAMVLLKKIPRLESVSWIVGQQLKPEIPAVESGVPGASAAEMSLGAKVLKLAIAFEHLRQEFPKEGAAIACLRKRSKEFDPNLIDALLDVQPPSQARKLLKVSTSRLRAGMILDQEIRNIHGVLLVAKGQEVTGPLIMRLESHAKVNAIDKEVMAYVPA